MSSNEPAIRVDGVFKRFELYESPRDRLKQFFIPRLRHSLRLEPKKYYKEFWALKDINFELYRGETVGILGKNGAGKSTLLQIICGTLSPTAGSVSVNGRTAALLELGSGFNPDYTGKENIYFNGALLGLSREELDNKYDQICAFADIGDFIDQPVKTYSSGMFARLAFAVAVNVEPQILIVDEALSVGDSWFQHKSMARMRRLMEGGATVLFVSHSIDAVRSLCKRAVWLDHGSMKMIGTSNEVTNKYMNDVFIEQSRLVANSIAQTSVSDEGTVRALGPVSMVVDEEKTNEKGEDDLVISSNVLTVTAVNVCNAEGKFVDKLLQGDSFSIVVKIKCAQPLKNLSIAIVIKDQFGSELTGESVFNKYKSGIHCKSDQELLVKFSSTMLLRGGQSYSVSVRVNSVSKWDRSDNVLLWCNETATVFDVLIDQENPLWFKFKQEFDVQIYE